MGKRGPKPRFLDVACPNEKCNLFGVAGKGNVTVYDTYERSSGKGRKFICHTCETTFCDRTNTPFYDLRTDEEKVKMALKMASQDGIKNGNAWDERLRDCRDAGGKTIYSKHLGL